MNQWLREHTLAVLILGWSALAGAMLVLAVAADGPGMFYDEAWLAQQGRAFVEPTREGLMPPGTQKAWLFGRPLPLFALPYLGSLKSQLLILPLALFGNELATTRLATLAIALAALFATMAAARRAFGTRTALLAGALTACDPSIFFHAQWEWGPFTTGWLCRALGAALLLRGHSTGQRASTWVGGLILGLGVYNRLDFLLIGVAALIGLLSFHASSLRDIWRRRRGELSGATAAFALGSLPMLLNLPAVFGMVDRLTDRGDLAERAHVLLATLDGSYAFRLMSVGGRFDALPEVAAPFGLLGLGALCAVALCVIDLARRGSNALRDGRGFLGVTAAIVAIAMLALPGATRAHHMLNLAPFVHLLVALQLVREFDRGGRRRILAAAAGIAILASGALSIASTRSLIESTGGRGWWSDSISELASELESERGAVAVSLDWGLHLQLLFLTSQPALLEPFWRMGLDVSRSGSWSHAGGPTHHYLVHDAPYDRFGFGPRLLVAARELGNVARIRVHRDREGEPAFYSVRVSRPHQLTLDRRGFHFRMH